MLVNKDLQRDIVAGLTGAAAGAPQAMGFALIAGVSPVYGLYTAVVATIVGALTSNSTFLTIAPTNALALVVFSTLSADARGTGIDALFTLTLLIGIFQVAFGLFRLGSMTRFVSNAVMIGFITGAGLLIILGQLGNFTGYMRPDDVTGVLPRFSDWLAHADRWDLSTLSMGLVALGIILMLRHNRLKYTATLIAIGVTSLLVVVFNWDSVQVVRDIAPIPSGLPRPTLPAGTDIAGLLPAALSMAVLALVQSVGITQSVREQEDHPTNVDRDFVAQGVANLAASVFQGMPAGGSISRTAITISAGARTRFANVFTGLFIAAMLWLFSGLIEQIILPALAAQLIIAAVGLIKVRQIRLVWGTGWSARMAMTVTFASTLVLPLEYSIFVGVALCTFLYLYTSSMNLDAVCLEPTHDNGFREKPVPEHLPDFLPTIIEVHGQLYFAAVYQLEQILPEPQGSHGAVVILRLRHNSEMGSTCLRFLRRYAEALEHGGGRLMLSGVSEGLHDQLVRTGTLQDLGEDNIFPATDTLFDATKQALVSAQHLASQH